MTTRAPCPSWGTASVFGAITSLAYWTHRVCFEHWVAPGERCLVYDFGIRQEPHFGVVLAEQHGCEVHAFDPSAVALKGWARGKARKKGYEWVTRGVDAPSYSFHEFGAGGFDGDVQPVRNLQSTFVHRITAFPAYFCECAHGHTLLCISITGYTAITGARLAS